MNTAKNGSIALAAILFIAMPFATAQAADVADSGYSYDYYVPADTGYSYDYYVPSDTGYSYDYYVPNSTYSAPSYSTPSYSGTGYITGSGYTTSGYVTGSGYIGSAPSNTYAPTNTYTYDNGNTTSCITTNSCSTYDNGNTYAPVWSPSYITSNTSDNGNTTNSGNTSTYAPVYSPTTIVTDSHNITDSHNVTTTNNTWSPPAIVSQPTQTQVVYVGSTGSYINPPPIYHPPVAYNYQNYQPTPYISLSQLPYTGLDLGFWGTIAYWGFLILWCLVAAYLVVVKKVQNRILRSISGFLFGDGISSHSPALALNGTGSGTSVSAPIATYTKSAPAAQVDAIDDFILSQINRARV